MGEQTGISWTHATLNFWVGCTKVSTGDKGACEFCYAETWAKRWPAYRDTWGTGAARILFQHLRAKARKLDKLALDKRAAGGGAFFCFSNSLSDIFDNEVPIEWLAEAFAIMREEAPNVTFLLLTKRAPNIIKRSRAAGGLPPNAALGITVVTQEEADRDIPHLLRAKAALSPRFVFLSMEPLMGPVDLENIKPAGWPRADVLRAGFGFSHPVDWVITGGESGQKARPTHPDWFRSLRDQCAAAGVPYHFKQWGEWAEAFPGETVEVDAGEQMAADILAEVKTPGWVTPAGAHYYSLDDLPADDTPCRLVEKVGKKLSGRLLDGVLHDAMPRAR